MQSKFKSDNEPMPSNPSGFDNALYGENLPAATGTIILDAGMSGNF